MFICILVRQWLIFWQDKERASRFQQSFLEEQKSLQAQEKASFLKTQKAEAKSRLNQLKMELRKQGLSGPEQRQHLTQVCMQKPVSEQCVINNTLIQMKRLISRSFLILFLAFVWGGGQTEARETESSRKSREPIESSAGTMWCQYSRTTAASGTSATACL